MKSFLFIPFLAVACALVVHAEIPAGWGTNYAETISAAESNQQPALIYFTANWCGPCKLMSRITLTEPMVVQAVSGIEHAAIDIDEHPDLAAKHHISAVPTFLMLSAAEVEAERATGFQATADFFQWLTNGISQARTVMVRQALARKNLDEVDQLLASTGTNSLPLAAAKLFDLGDERSATVAQAVASRLKIIANRYPTALLEGLNDSRLATRIQVANALRNKIGDAFDVDPWSDAAIRETKILAWRKALAKTP
jgi:thioredoxin 1